MSRLPLSGTNDDTNSDLELSDPTDIDVYFIGGSGVRPPLRRRTGSVLGGLEESDVTFAAGEVEYSPAPRTTDEQAQLLWQVLQSDRNREIQQITPPENKRVYAIRDDSPSTFLAKNVVRSGHLEPGLMLHVCAMTQEGRELLHPKFKPEVAVINPEGGGSRAGAAAVAGNTNRAAGPSDFSEDEADREAECEHRETLCQKTSKDWATAPLNDQTTNLVRACIENGVAISDTTEEGLGAGTDLQEVKRLVARGQLLELPSSENTDPTLIACPRRPTGHPGQYERLLGDEPVRTYVPLRLRPWAMDCAHKEAVHLGEKVTLRLLHRFYWWIGMAESIKWWIRRCYTCQARTSTRLTVRWPLISLPLPTRPGQMMVSFDLLGALPTTTSTPSWL